MKRRWLWATFGLVVSTAMLAANEEPVVTLERMFVFTDTKLSFCIGLKVFKNQDTKKVVSLFVDRVLKDSDADATGLKPGDEIVSIDGREVTEFEASFMKGTDLNKIFVGRKEGDVVTLGVKRAGGGKPVPMRIVQTRYAREKPRTTVTNPLFKAFESQR